MESVIKHPDLTETLAAIERVPLGEIPPVLAAKVMRRIVDEEALSPRLDVSAFNSAT